jgi:hypothetical protein
MSNAAKSAEIVTIEPSHQATRHMTPMDLLHQAVANAPISSYRPKS